mmetsp:Transcript_525/g.922  ORF Transcript_525/g.922 Transcript_525/m.922 type:complete len:415 (+) Transcript_525:125-1369(+)
MSNNQSEPLQERDQVLRGFLSNDLKQFQSSRQMYVTLEAARSLIQEISNEENIPNNSSSLPKEKENNKMMEMSTDLGNEILGFQKEMSKKEFYLEKLNLMNKGNDVKRQGVTPSNDKTLLALQAEIEQADIVLQRLKTKSEQLDSKIAESEELKIQADAELQVAKQHGSEVVETEHNDGLPARNMTSEQSECVHASMDSNFEKETQALKCHKADLDALMAGLETILQLKLQNVEVTVGNGVLFTVVISGTHTFSFELDEKKKLVDIHMLEDMSLCREGGRGVSVVDPLRLLCDCAQLAPPLDLRHALLATTAALHREQALSQHIKEISLQKLCLLQRHDSDPYKVDVAFRNGINAVLKVHESYPNVPNGVHIESLTSVGGWSEEELRVARPYINNRCLQTLRDMIVLMLSTFDE